MMDEQESLVLRNLETIIFTEETKFEDIEPYIYSDSRLSDCVNIFREQIYEFEWGEERRLSEVDELEQVLSNSVPSKQKEVLYAILYEQKNFLFNVDQSSPDEPTLVKHEDHKGGAPVGRLQKTIKRDYENGFDYPIKHYKEEARNVFEHEKLKQKNMPKEDETFDWNDYDGYSFGKPLKVFLENYSRVFILPIFEVVNAIERVRYCSNRLQSVENLNFESKEPATQKLKWKGKPAHLALIIDLLIDKGYLEATPYGERTANILLQFIEIEGYKNSIEALGKLLHKDRNVISDKYAIDLFYKIPERKDLK